MKQWIVFCAIGGTLLICRPSFAADSLLYKVDPQAFRSPVGQTVPGAPDIRAIQPYQQSALNAKELSTVQPERFYRAMFAPNDPQYVYQWNLPAMNMATAWDADSTPPLYGGDSSVIVAVLDSGIASTLVGGAVSLPDMNASTIWTNSAEISGDGIDNDLDGFIDDVHGWNFVANTNKPADDNRHGSHISNVIAEAMNNSLAVTGIASNVTIMPLKVLDGDGIGSTSALTAAIQYAVAHGASIINLSLGGTEDDPLFHQAIQAAAAKGVVVVAAAGNDGVSPVTYPARYSEVISVGATQYDNTRASYSNYGSTLDIVAPGGNEALDQNADGQPDGILAQTCTTGACTATDLIYISGTSQAAAEVSAVAALLRSCGVAGTSIKTVLTSTARDLGVAGRDDEYGAGIVDAAAAMTSAGCTSPLPSAPVGLVAQAGATAKLQLVSGRAYAYTKPVFSWSGASGATFQLTLSRSGTVQAQSTQTTLTYSPTISKEGTYTLSVVSVDALNRASSPVTFEYRYRRPVTLLSSTDTVKFISSDFKVTKSIALKGANNVMASGGFLVTGQSGRLLLNTQSSGSAVSITDTNGKKLKTVYPFGKKYTGTITTAIEQLADGSSLLVMATATGGSSIAWATPDGTPLGTVTVIPKDTRGLTLATGDVNGDGNDEVIVGQVYGAQVLVYDSAQTRIAKLLPRGKSFRQGWVVATGDRDGDGTGEILLTPSVPQSPPKILILDLAGIEKKSFMLTGLPKKSLVTIQGNDVTGDGKAELIVATRTGTTTMQSWSLNGKLLKSVIFTPTSSVTLSSLR